MHLVQSSSLSGFRCAIVTCVSNELYITVCVTFVKYRTRYFPDIVRIENNDKSISFFFVSVRSRIVDSRVRNSPGTGGANKFEIRKE